jgi:hypothetical protein
MDTNQIQDFQTEVKSAQLKILRFEELPDDAVVAFSSDSALAKSEAENIIVQPTVKKRICAGLQSISDDLNNITDKIIEELWPLAIAGTLLIPQNPIIYGWIGILVYRATVKGFCAEFHHETEHDKK